MRIEQGNNLIRVKATNQSAILRMIYYFGPIKRAEIAKRLDLTLPTITTNVSNMISEGIVREIGCREPESAGFGRKAHPLEVVPSARHFIGIETTGSRRAVCVVDYCGREYYSCYDTEQCPDYDKNMEKTCGLVERCLKECHMTWEKISGICIGLPGVVERGAGKLKVHPRNQWNDKDIRKDLKRWTGYEGEILVENNACVRALGAQLYRRSQLENVKNFAYLFVDTGIACPLIVNSSDHIGSLVGAGEVGHMVMDPNGPKCTCGNHGCLEACSSDSAIIRRCLEVMEQGGAKELEKICGGDSPSIRQVMEAQEAGDRDVCAVVESAIHTLGVAVANILNFTSPDGMLIDCNLFRNQSNWNLLLETARANLCTKTYQGTQAIFVEPDPVSGAKGAAAVAILHDLES